MAYSTDAITDYGANLNTIHDSIQNRFNIEGKKDSNFGMNNIVVSSLYDDDTPADSSAHSAPKPEAPAPAAAPEQPPKPAKLNTVNKDFESKMKQETGGKGSTLMASLVEPTSTTVEAGGLKIEVSQLEDLD